MHSFANFATRLSVRPQSEVSMSSSIIFGEHLTIDGYGGAHHLLNDKNLVERCLQTLPQLIGMHPIAAPAVHWADPNEKKDPGGWSGYVLIAESHISAHTFPSRGFLSADVYTCKGGLDKALVVQYFVDCFGLDATEVNFFLRGTQYPSHNIHTRDDHPRRSEQ
jgi:S-adenosylmethionine decarboxylase